MTVAWLPKAMDRVHQIAEFMAQDNPERAFDWLNRIYDAADPLETFPEMGRMVPELQRPEIRELIFERRYRVIYRLKEDLVEVLTVIHGRQQLDPKELE